MAPPFQGVDAIPFKYPQWKGRDGEGKEMKGMEGRGGKRGEGEMVGRNDTGH